MVACHDEPNQTRKTPTLREAADVFSALNYELHQDVEGSKVGKEAKSYSTSFAALPRFNLLWDRQMPIPSIPSLLFSPPE
jgi:hypothetical protein